MEKRVCKICNEKTSDIDHIDRHPHNVILNYIYSENKDYYMCNMCPAKKEEESKMKLHLYEDHDKEERFVQISEDASGKYFTY
jgi:phage anti-repressor protein